MGYGGTGYATVDVDIVQTDVDAIVDSLTGMNGSTLSDLEYRLLDIDGYLYDGFYSAVDWLSYIESYTSSMEGYLGGWYSGPLYDGSYGVVEWLNYIESNTSYIEEHLYYSGYSAAELLGQIYYISDDVWDSVSQAIRTVAA
jgi:hypothetical protein